MSGAKPLGAAASRVTPGQPAEGGPARAANEHERTGRGPRAETPVTPLDTAPPLPPAGKGLAPKAELAMIAAFDKPPPRPKPWESALCRLDVQVGKINVAPNVGMQPTKVREDPRVQGSFGVLLTLFAGMDWEDPRAWRALFKRLFGPPDMTERDIRLMVERWGGDEVEAKLAVANFLASKGKYASAAALYVEVINDAGADRPQGGAARHRLALMFSMAAHEAARVADEAGGRAGSPDSAATASGLAAALLKAAEARGSEAKVLLEAGRLYRDAMAAPAPRLQSDDERQGYAASRRDMLMSQLELCARLQQTAAGFADLSGRAAWAARLPVASGRAEVAARSASGAGTEIPDAASRPAPIATRLQGLGAAIQGAAADTLQQSDRLLAELASLPEVKADAAGELAARVWRQRLQGPQHLVEAAGEASRCWESRTALCLVALVRLNNLAASAADARPAEVAESLRAARASAATRLRELCRAAPVEAVGAPGGAEQLLRAAREAILVATQSGVAVTSS